MGRRIVLGWLGALGAAIIPTAASANAGGLTTPTCVPLGVLLALTITPVESLVQAFTSYLPRTD